MITAAAADTAARRIAAKLADLAVLRPAIGDTNPPLEVRERLDDAQLAVVEAALGVALPEAFRAFARHVGTVGAGPDYGLTGTGVAMPDALPQVTSTVTTVDGERFSAGTGERAPLEGKADPRRPFPLDAVWTPVDDDGDPVAPELAAGAHLYDGTMQLAEIGCGYFYFLVLAGPRAGEVWVDYSAGDGSIAPIAPFLDWYERWVDDWLVGALGAVLRAAMPPAEPSPHDATITRWAHVIEERGAKDSATGAQVGDLVTLRLYQRRLDDADTGIAALEALPPAQVDQLPKGMREMLTIWRYPDAMRAARAQPPEVELAIAHAAWRVRRNLADNRATPPSVLARLARDARPEIRYVVATHPAVDPSVLSALLDAAAVTWTTTPDDREALYMMDLVARHPAAGDALLATLAAWDRTWPACRTAPWVVRGVAMNPAISSTMLAALAAHAHPCVREAVARVATDPALLDALVDDADEHVRRSVAVNPAGSEAARQRLARDPASDVRYRLAGVPGLSPSLQLLLACDTSTSPSLVLADRADLADDARALLLVRPGVTVKVAPVAGEEPADASDDASDDDDDASDDDDDASDDDAAAPAAPPPPAGPVDFQILGSGDTGRGDFMDPNMDKRPRAALATLVTGRALGNPGYPAPLLTPFVADPDTMVGYAIGGHPWLDDDTLRALATSSYAYTRSNLAGRAALPADVLATLLTDRSPLVQRALADHHDVPADVVTAWAAGDHEDTRWAAAASKAATPAQLATLARDPARWVRRAVVMNPRAPADLVELALADEDPDVRLALTWRADLSAAMLDRLLADPSPVVQTWARYRAARDRALATLG